VSVDTDADVARLQAVLRDLVALSAVPAMWAGGEPPAVAAGLADTLLGLLELDFAFVRLTDPSGGAAVEATCGSAWTGFQEWLHDRLSTTAPFLRKEVLSDVGAGSERRSGFAAPVGFNGEGGVVIAASRRVDFPTSTDQLLLSVAANQAAAAFQTARLIAERTAELHVANEELGALRRVATLVAEGVQTQDLFAVVAEEVAHVVNVPLISVIRYEPDRTVTECASYPAGGPLPPVGTRWPLEGSNVLRIVHASSEPARVDDYSQLEGGQAAEIRRSGVRSVVGVPIVVAGRVWGAMIGCTTEREPLPEGTEARLADFTELLATAIENAESREALAQLVDEQAGLRRVATLVARDVQPTEIFSAVVEEVGRLFGTDTGAVVRFEHDPPAIVVAGVAKTFAGIPVGTRSKLDDSLASAQVYRSGRSARIDVRDWPAPGGPIHSVGRRMGLASTVASPISVEGRLWGAMTISAEDPLPPDAEERLEKFTELVATAIANADSRSELAASRRRIVAASDEARRRIERDLHDGTQQRLISLGLAVRAAEAGAPSDAGDLRAQLSRISSDLGAAVADLQEISRGIHPATLSRGGLGPALRALARRSTIPVQLSIATDTRLPEPIEVAAYYVTSEALANAAKHSQASQIEVSLAMHDGRLLLSIRDDGRGGADPAGGSGLVGLTDRVQALGGTVRVSSPPADGTCISAELPVEPELPETRASPPAGG
jgi:signal transduction histidine kinase